MADDARMAPSLAEPREYALLDLGAGRQLARFGALVVDRPYPAAVDSVVDPAVWATTDLRYERPDDGGTGEWVSAASRAPDAWTMTHAGMTFELRPTASGQVGFFGEQIEPWRWIGGAVRGVAASIAPAAPAILNLFAYTGGGTLAALAAGAAVTHLDASRSAVAWARRNADLSGLANAPVRWIADDAVAFVEREARRGRRYQGLIIDPPSYGHGPNGERWSLSDHLAGLLDACLAVAAQPGFLLLTAHAEGLRPGDLGFELAAAFTRSGRADDAGRVESGPLVLHAASGADAPAGVYARWRSHADSRARE